MLMFEGFNETKVTCLGTFRAVSMHEPQLHGLTRCCAMHVGAKMMMWLRNDYSPGQQLARMQAMSWTSVCPETSCLLQGGQPSAPPAPPPAAPAPRPPPGPSVGSSSAGAPYGACRMHFLAFA